MSHFKLISSTKASDVIPINKYVSQKTGITVIIGDVEGPLVNGFFCLATEAHDDDGLPHTLEHLIFLGSERYPYKGILDLLANRCMAHGTNAWTDTDHTCYTVSTAGDAGMLTLLPIYLDHILWPTLTEQGFITEVHHISGDGEDAGVVYCEMQGRENTAQSRCELRLLRAMYPNSGYSAETGGIMENLRTSTNNAKVKNYHKKFYRPENLTIILTGQIEADDVFNALAIVEDDIIAKRVNDPREQWVKPWQTVPPPAHFGEMKEQWPADIEDCGQVSFGWRGPGLTGASALKELTSCAILLRYLCDTAAAPLQRCLVEREDALAGDVSYNLTENLVSVIRIDLDNVPIDKLEMARTEARNCLANLCSGVEPIDMERIHRLLRKQLRESNASLESDPHNSVAFRAIGDAIYSQNEQDFFSRMNPQHDLRALMEETSDYWLAVLQTYFNDDVITVIGSPSIEMQTRMAEEEKKRIEEQRVRLGQEGLAEKEAQLTEAIEFNERPPPDGTLSSVPIPSCASLKFHAVSTWSSDAAACPHLPLDELPFYARVHSLKTNFVYISLIFDTSAAAEASRRWTPLHTSALGEWAVRRGADLVPHEEVISATERLTVLFNGEMGIGSSGNFSVGHYGNLLHIETRCEPEDYEAVVNHLYEVLYASEITKERLLVFAQRLINEVAQLRRNGSKMAHDTLLDAICSKDTNVHWCSLLRQQRFLKQLVEQLGAGGDSAEAALRDARDALADITRNAWLHLATDFDRYTLSAEPWKKFQGACSCPGSQITENQPKQLPKYSDLHLMSKWDGGGFVVGVGGLESSFVMQMSPGPLSNALDDVAPLYVALNYFTQLEGPMWRSIRGCGLSYGYGVSSAPREGRLQFSLYKATNTIAAYSKAKSIMEEYLADSKFDEDLFASAKSTALFEVVESKNSPADVVRQSLLNVIQGVGENYISEVVCGVSAVTGESAHAAAARWLPALLRPQRAKLAVVCHPSKVTDIQAAFHKLGIELEAFESIEASHFNK